MNSKLPHPWSVGGAGLAAIVALPTSVDRSVRVSSSVDGVGSEACRPLDITAGSLQIIFDYRFGRLPTHSSLLSIRSRSVTVLSLVIAPDGGAVLVAGDGDADGAAEPPGSSIAPATTAAPNDWERLQVNIDQASGIVGWGVHDASGAETASGSISMTDLAAIDTFCLLSPAGSPSGWVAIDDLFLQG